MPVDSTARGMAAAALAALTGGTSALSASSLALGGATIGSNALAVTGTTSFGGALLSGDAANVLAQVNGTSANTFRVYNTSSSSNANYERGVFGWTDTTNVLTIGTQNAGTSVARHIQFVVGGANVLDYGVTNANQWTFNKALNMWGFELAMSNGPISGCNSFGLVGSSTINWNADTGLSRVSPGVLAAGNGTSGNTSAVVQAAGYAIGATTVLSGQSTGYGTPTGGAKQASFNAAAIALPNLAACVAQLIIDLKAGNMPAA